MLKVVTAAAARYWYTCCSCHFQLKEKTDRRLAKESPEELLGVSNQSSFLFSSPDYSVAPPLYSLPTQLWLFLGSRRRKSG